MSVINDLIEVGRILYRKNLVVGKLGNISARVKEGFVITSSGSSLGSLRADDFVFLSEEGKAKEGKQPSTETPLHLEIYQKRSDINAIIHTHSPYSVIVGLKSSQVNFSSVFMEGKLEAGKVPFFPSGSEELSRETARVLSQKDVALLEKHGVVTVGKNPFEALYLAETIEHLSKLIYLLRIWER